MVIIDSENIFGIIGRTLGYVNDSLLNHGERVAYMVLKMMEEDGRYSKETIRSGAFLAAFHDIGAYKTEEIENILQFEVDKVWDHSVYGYLFVTYMTPFKDMAAAVLFHHLEYDKLKKIDAPYKELAAIIKVADRIDVGLNSPMGIKVVDYIHKDRGTRFSPEAVDLFDRVEEKYHVIQDIQSGKYLGQIKKLLKRVPFDEHEIDDFLEMLVSTIDFRSEYTVTHTIITTSIAVELGRKLKLDESALIRLNYGTLLHDLGKIGIPMEILEYPGKLNFKDMEKMKTHVNLTEKIMGGDIEEETMRISLRHHEKLDGSGYPRGLRREELTLPERIVAVADIVSALSGKRSYKEPFDTKLITKIILEMKDAGQLCPEVVDVMINEFDHIMEKVKEMCKPTLKAYTNISTEYETLKKRLEDF
ncbi:MAG: HD domain-containing protein [Anaerovoracaceae bacterium]